MVRLLVDVVAGQGDEKKKLKAHENARAQTCCACRCAGAERSACSCRALRNQVDTVVSGESGGAGAETVSEVARGGFARHTKDSANPTAPTNMYGRRRPTNGLNQLQCEVVLLLPEEETQRVLSEMKPIAGSVTTSKALATAV